MVEHHWQESRNHMMIKTKEQRDIELINAVESLDDAEKAGEMLSRDAIVTLYGRVTEASNAIRAAEGR